MKSKGVAVRAHDVIPYIMCLGTDGKSARSAQADKAFHPDDLRRQGSELKIGESSWRDRWISAVEADRIDYDFYLDSQVLQPILRLCENIEGTERARLAECLGQSCRTTYTESAARARKADSKASILYDTSPRCKRRARSNSSRSNRRSRTRSVSKMPCRSVCDVWVAKAHLPLMVS